MPGIIAWTVYDPKGKPMLAHIRTRREYAMYSICTNWMTWKSHFYRAGYRLHRIVIKWPEEV